MDFTAILDQISSLSVEDRIRLVQAIWNSVDEDESRPLLTEMQKQELGCRMKEDTKDTDDELTWQEVKSSIKPDTTRAVAESILFYSLNKAYGEFSNFSKHPIELDGKTWPTSEHYFQAQKFVGTEHEELIRAASTPMQAAKMGRDRSRPLRHDWEKVKDDIMRKAVSAKFQQHSDLRSLLLSTGKATIIEHTKNDRYWGDGGDGLGTNMLGIILMETRTAL